MYCNKYVYRWQTTSNHYYSIYLLWTVIEDSISPHAYTILATISMQEVWMLRQTFTYENKTDLL